MANESKASKAADESQALTPTAEANELKAADERQVAKPAAGATAAKPTGKSKASTTAENAEEEGAAMSFWDHLEVLRWAVFRSAIVLVVVMIGTFIAMPYIFDHFILAATSSDFFVYRWLSEIGQGVVELSPDFEVQIININVASQFMTHISTSLSMAAIIAFPYFIWEIWRFIEPALFEDEIRHVRPAFVGGTLMFYLGCAVGYLLVFPFTFRFLVEYDLSPNIVNQINLQSYIDNFTMLILVMGLVFEMPLLAWLLSNLGILRKGFLKTYKRHAIVILLVSAAIITPSGDPFTLMLVFLPLYILYELSIIVVKADKPEEEDEDKE